VGPSPKFHDDRGILLKLAAEGSKACNRKVEVRRNATKAAGWPADPGLGPMNRWGVAHPKILLTQILLTQIIWFHRVGS
jgi:hypothetical protein